MNKIAPILVALTLAVTASAQKLVIKGSDTLGAKLVPLLAEAYKAKHPGVTFEIAAEGSTTGISAIIDGTAQVGMSSRPAKSTEISAALAKGVKLTPVEVSHDGLAVIVNEKNPVMDPTPTLRSIQHQCTPLIVSEPSLSRVSWRAY